MDKRFRHRMTFPGPRRSSDIASLILICITCVLFIHSSNLRSSLEEIALSAPSGSETPDSAQALRAPVLGQPEVVSVQSLNRRVGPPINRTGEAQQQDLMVFTKITRCGSTPIGHVLNGLASRSHQFSVWDENPRKGKRLLPATAAEALQAIKDMDGVSKPAAVIMETSHLDFTSRGFKKPIYVSMVRDPLEHAHSWFYWLRAPFAVVERALAYGREEAVNHLPKAAFLKKNFEFCLSSNDPECSYHPGVKRIGHPMQAFCTRSKDCASFASRAALQEAMRTVEEEYAVVGVLEDWDTSLAVMEKLVPRFFDGATAVYRESVAPNRTRRNENFYKPKLRGQIRQKMAKDFQAEIEFYEFVKQRLYKQYASLK